MKKAMNTYRERKLLSLIGSAAASMVAAEFLLSKYTSMELEKMGTIPITGGLCLW